MQFSENESTGNYHVISAESYRSFFCTQANLIMFYDRSWYELALSLRLAELEIRAEILQKMGSFQISCKVLALIKMINNDLI